MHEFGICERIVEGVLEELNRVDPPPRLIKSRLVVGRLHQLIPEHMRFAYEVLTRDTPAAGSELEVIVKPITGRCRACGWEGEIEPPFFRCGECKERAIETIGGRELYLDSLEIETDEPE